MKYLDWLKTNPEKGYYWVKYQDCDEERIDEFTDWYDNAGNVETKFTEQPDEVISDRLIYIDYLDMVGHCGAYSEENAHLKEELESALCKISGRNYELSEANKLLNVDIAKTYKEKEKLEELLKDLMSEANDALQAVQNDCENENFSIYQYPEVQNFYLLYGKLKGEIKDEKNR